MVAHLKRTLKVKMQSSDKHYAIIQYNSHYLILHLTSLNGPYLEKVEIKILNVLI